MINSNLAEVEEVFHEAMSYDPEERVAYLSRACEGNAVLRHEVESLVSAYESGSGLLDHTAVTLAMKVIGSHPDDSMVGQEIGFYRIVSCLGQGGMGAVYLAEDLRLNRKVALKFLSSDFISDTWAKRQLIREAQAVAMLDHANICAVYGFEEIADHSFIVMQYIEGETLADLIRSDKLKSTQIVPLAQQIVSALGTAHAHGIIHRDIKPKNIMVTPGGQVKVLDFGLAKTMPKNLEDATESISQLSKDGLLAGTIAYMSPEQLRGEKLDYRSDIFSMGTVLYEMASGKNPHAHDTNAEIISAIMVGDPKSLRQAAINCPKDLDHIVGKCLQKDRANRYQSVAELVIDLDKLNRGVTLPSLRRSYLNLRTAAIAAMVLLALVVVNFVYVGLTKPRHTLAVLPIICETGNNNSPCLGQKVAAGLVRELSHHSDLKIKSPDEPMSPAKAGRALGVDTVFYGKIKNRDNQLILQTWMENVADGTLIPEEYPLKTENLTTLDQAVLEREVSLRTAISLQLSLSDEEHTLLAALATNQNRIPEAYQLYLQGRALWNKRDRDNIQKAIDYFKQATDLDPSFARAYAGMAECYVLMSSVAYGSIPTKDAMTRAEAAAKEALEIDPSLPEAHTSFGAVWMRYHWDWDKAEKEFKRAIELRKDFAPAHYWYSNLLAITGRKEESLKESEIARDLEPFSPPEIMNYCRAMYLARDFKQADICLDDLAKEYPNYVSGKYIHGLVYIQKGMYQEATQIYEQIYAHDPAHGGAMLGYCYGITNRKDEAIRVLSEMQALSQTRGYLPSQELAIIYLGLNDRDQAFAFFRAAADERFASLTSIFVDPLFDGIKSDPRFVALSKDLKLPLNPPG